MSELHTCLGAEAIERRRTGELLDNRPDNALRTGEERFRRCFEMDLIGMAIQAPTKAYLQVNDELCRFLRYQRRELLRMSWAQTVHPQDIPAHDLYHKRMLSGEIDSYRHELRWIRKDAEVVESVIAARCVRQADGAVDHLVTLILDTTERKRAQEALAQAKLELSQMTRISAMGELAGSIVHEVKRPLAAIVTSASACARLLAASPANLCKATLAIDQVVRDATRADQLVTHIRQFLRHGRAQRSHVDINEVVADVIAIVESELRRADIALAIPRLNRLPAVLADRTQLRQVLLNLVTNSVEAMRSVEERVRVLKIRTARRADNMLCISVCDSGPGLDPRIKELTFQPFLTTKPEGIDLGLAISRAIVEAHGGRLWVARRGARGTTFCLTVPFAGPIPPSPTEPGPTITQSQHQLCQ
jgi:PAS domain S-box-containing protein